MTPRTLAALAILSFVATVTAVAERHTLVAMVMFAVTFVFVEAAIRRAERRAKL